jgi:hypothetical protein
MFLHATHTQRHTHTQTHTHTQQHTTTHHHAAQINGVINCLQHLGPWCAAAAAYLDLLAPPADARDARDADGADGARDAGGAATPAAQRQRRQAAAAAARLVSPGGDDEEDEEDSNPVLVQGGDTCRVFEDDLGGPPEVLLGELRRVLLLGAARCGCAVPAPLRQSRHCQPASCTPATPLIPTATPPTHAATHTHARTHAHRSLLQGMVVFLQLHVSQGMHAIITAAELSDALTPRPEEMPAVAAEGGARGSGSAPSLGGGAPAAAAAAAAAGSEPAYEWCARRLLRLASKVALLISMNALADMLVDDQQLKGQLMAEAGASLVRVCQRACACVRARVCMLVQRCVCVAVWVCHSVRRFG